MYAKIPSRPDIIGWIAAMPTESNQNPNRAFTGRERKIRKRNGNMTYICTSSGKDHNPNTIDCL